MSVCLVNHLVLGIMKYEVRSMPTYLRYVTEITIVGDRDDKVTKSILPQTSEQDAPQVKRNAICT